MPETPDGGWKLDDTPFSYADPKRSDPKEGDPKEGDPKKPGEGDEERNGTH